MLGQGFFIGAPGIRYRSKATFTTTTTIAKPSGVMVGDVVFVLCPTGASGVNHSLGWSVSEITGSLGQVGRLFRRVLDATDVSSGWSLSSALSGVAVAYAGRGATTLTEKSTASNGVGGGSLTLAGFTPAANSKGAFAAMTDADATPPTAPSGFVGRHLAAVGSVSVGIADREGIYDGGNVVFGTTVGNPEFGWLYEVT